MRFFPGRTARGAAAPDAAAARFAALVLPHADAAYNLALRLTRAPEAAEDIVHDAFLRAMAGIGALRGADARPWLLAIVRNGAFDWLRARRRRAEAPLVRPFAGEDDDDGADLDPPDPDQESPEAALIRRGEAVALHAALDSLPPALREVLVLREMEELSYRQIAEVTGAPIGTVMSRLARGRARLSQAWRRLDNPEARP